MIIYSSTSSYMVKAKIGKEHGIEYLLAENDRGDETMLVYITDKHIIRRITPLFLVYSENREFSDFIEAFAFESALVAVFAHNSKLSDLPLLDDEVVAEKPELFLVVLKCLTSQNLPWPIVCDVCREGNILYSADGVIKLNYRLKLGGEYKRDCKKKAQTQLAALVRELLTGYDLNELKSFIRKLERAEFKSLSEILLVYTLIYGELLNAKRSNEVQKSTFERIREFKETLQKQAFTIVGVLLLIAGYLLLAYTIYTTLISPPPIDNGINAIGTVVVNREEE